MSTLAQLSTDNSIADEKDSVGNGSFTLDSGIYDATVGMAYLTKSVGGALGLNLTLKIDKREVRQTLWMTSGTDKGGKNYYEKEGEKFYLPGFNHANSLALLTVAKEISAIDTEMKMVAVYNRDAKSEVPTKVEVLMELIGKEIAVGLIKQRVDKNKRNEATGVYEPTGEVREENEVDKLFRARDRMTTSEIRSKAETAEFADMWKAKWEGQVRDRVKGAAPGTAPKAASKKPTASLFG